MNVIFDMDGLMFDTEKVFIKLGIMPVKRLELEKPDIWSIKL